ncbi:hypothetical protein HYDPIDRAFT_29803 [Hydnomerulius pinastri MD-312]|uniref:Uncharacterized protein n=1 Tax=Hydnomerulius pinastri MD-312 TaxID=994086 RepID=A0A0C9VBT7_9AGAM|nr:hypothetical protein HYDPIDRAFT_29803 [Hydnomerulius pinastri MD-312]
MSSRANPRFNPDQGYLFGGADPPAAGPSSGPSHWQQPEASWASNQTMIDQGNYAHPNRYPDMVGVMLEDHDAEDMVLHQPLGYNDHSVQSVSLSSDFSRMNVGSNAVQPAYNVTHFDNSFIDLPFHYYPDPEYWQPPNDPQSQPDTYHINYGVPQQPSIQHPGSSMQGYLPRPSQGAIQSFQGISASSNPNMRSAPHPQLHDRTVFGAATDSSARSSPGGFPLRSVSTATPLNSDAGQHSHPSPVTMESAGWAPGPSYPALGTLYRPMPSSPERKRSLEDYNDFSTERRVFARHDRASSVHSAASDMHRRGSSSSSHNVNLPGRGPRIPQARYAAGATQNFNFSDGKRESVKFNLERPVELGIRISDILDGHENFLRLEDRKGLVEAMGKTTVSLRFQWPGYQLWTKAVASKNWKRSRSPLTREKLAEVVAKAVQQFIKDHRNAPCDVDNTAWRVGPNGIQVADVVLVALHHVSTGSWQPELCLLNPRR